MRIFQLETDEKIQVIDIFSGVKQIFQGVLPDLNSFFVKSPQHADIYIVPHDSSRWTRRYLKYVSSRSNEKTILYFNRSDNPTKFNLHNAISLQHSVPPGKHKHKIIVMPFNVQSLDHLPFRPYDKATISFVGYLPRIVSRRLINSFTKSPNHPLKSNGSIVRRIGIRKLSRFPNALINTRPYYGGAASNIPSPQQHRREFIDSIQNSDFVFSPRGDANGSQRFFEVISCGRIPIVPMTDIRLPILNDNGLKPVFLEVKTLSSNLISSVNSFWNSIDSEVYLEMQNFNRNLYRSHLNFASYLNRLFELDGASDLAKYVLNENA